MHGRLNVISPIVGRVLALVLCAAILSMPSAADSDADDGQLRQELADIIDRNHDNIEDIEQDNVKSVDTYNDNGTITFESETGTSINDYKSIGSASTIYPEPEDVEFPYGFLSFTLNGISAGGSTAVTIILPANAIVDTYYKFGQTPEDGTDHWYEFLYDEETETGAVISGNEITLYFKDGWRGDNDLDDANGIIVDPGGPGLINTDTENPFGFDGDGDGGGSDGGWCFISSLMN